MEKIEIYTDGSCKGNPGPGGWAATFLDEKADQPFTVLFGNTTNTTNNRMEMMAVIEALRYIHNHNLTDKKIHLYTDSNLIVQTVNQGWKKKKNTDLWEEFDRLLEKLDIRFEWVKGHSNNHWNNETDKIALSEAEKAAKRVK
ncbi:MAG: ribonuclease H [Candidatus Gracilibacteria bacterium]|nr:ribonuclease HI [Candidatus Peregrinibacteria bacterium]